MPGTAARHHTARRRGLYLRRAHMHRARGCLPSAGLIEGCEGRAWRALCHGEPRGEGREAHSCYRGHLPGRCTGLECQWGRPEGRRGSAWRALCRAGEHARCCPAGGICARLSGAHGVSGPRTAPLGPPTGLSSAAPWRSASGGEAPRTALAPPRTAIAVATEVTAVAPGGLPPGPEGQFCAPGATRGGPRAPAPHATCSLCAGAPGGDEGASLGPQMAFLAAWPPRAAQRHSHRPHGTAS